MKTQRFGLELEFTGITRSIASQVVCKVLNGTSYYEGGNYGTYATATNDGRKWKVMSDSSVRAEVKGGGYAGHDCKCEFVTPICTYNDIEVIQEIARALKKAGAMVNESTGIHIHIDASTHTARSLKNITSIMASKESLLFKALQTTSDRMNKWCKKVDSKLISDLNKNKPTTLEEVKRIWYNGRDGSGEHYHNSRYHALNLHAVWQKGTVEFSLFNGTLHAGKIKAYIQLCMAISNQAKTLKSASSKETVTSNEKYTFRTWLLRLGLIGEEFKTARLHLLANLEGDTAFRHGRDGTAA